MVTADCPRREPGAMAVLVIAGAAEIWMLAALAAVTGAATGFFNHRTGCCPKSCRPRRFSPPTRCAPRELGERSCGRPSPGILVATAGAGWAIAVEPRRSRSARSSPCAPAPLASGAASHLSRPPRGWIAFRSRRVVWLWSPTSSHNDLGSGAPSARPSPTRIWVARPSGHGAGGHGRGRPARQRHRHARSAAQAPVLVADGGRRRAARVPGRRGPAPRPRDQRGRAELGMTVWMSTPSDIPDEAFARQLLRLVRLVRLLCARPRALGRARRRNRRP